MSYCFPPRLVFAELKTERGELEPAQERVLDVLRATAGPDTAEVYGVPEPRRDAGSGRIEVYVWRPSDFRDPIEDSAVFRILRGGA